MAGGSGAGSIFRSATLANLTGPTGLVAALGIRTVCDLRGVNEAALRPSRLPPSAPSGSHLPIEPSVGASLRDLMLREESTGEDVRLSAAPRLSSITSRASSTSIAGCSACCWSPRRQAVLFHCSAGKDRTGVGAALVLTALGATRQTVVADYRATDRIWRRDHSLPEGTPAGLANALLSTHAELLEETLERAIAAHGGLDGLLEDGLGLDAAAAGALRGAYLE